MRYAGTLAAVAILAVVGCGGNRSIPTGLPSQIAVPDFGAAALTRIELDARSRGAAVSSDVYGASLDTWYDFRQRFVNPSLHATGIHLLRFPGGSESDVYHWENGGSLCFNYGYIAPGSTFDHFMSRVAGPLNLDAAITLNYGSNRSCNAGGEPGEAAAWAAYAKKRGYRVSYWTVGNEVYGSWEYDLHAHPHDPYTYADAVRNGYYPAMKKADASAAVGIVVDVPTDRAWNDVVLRRAQPFDFVELHYYPEYNVDSDGFLLGDAVDDFAQILVGLRAEMNAAGVPKSVPIYLGEYNNDAGNEGKQSVSIVNGLYVGQMLGTMANAGVPRATFWLAYGSCDETGDYSKKLYGWQRFGSEALFSDGLPNPYEGCSSTPKIAGGTPFPTARVMGLMAADVPAGSQARGVSVSATSRNSVRAYGFAQGSGFTFAIFNNTLSPIAAQALVKGSSQKNYDATLAIYGKAQYDQSKQNKWVGPVQRSLGRVGPSVRLTLGPYSLSMLRLR